MGVNVSGYQNIKKEDEKKNIMKENFLDLIKMDEQFINNVINKYKFFRQNLEEQIKNNQIKLQNNDCYLIKDNWDIALSRVINSYELQKKFKRNNANFTLPKQNPEFINDISSFVECISIRKWNRFKLISKELIDLVNEKLNLKLYQNSIVKYYTGNNKLIIEFKNKNENNAILINGPLSKYYIFYFIEIKKNDWENKSLYNKILSIKELNEKIIKEEFNNIIISRKEFINNKNNNSSIKNNFNKQNNNIIKEQNNSFNSYPRKYFRLYHNNDNNSKEDNNKNINNSILNNIYQLSQQESSYSNKWRRNLFLTNPINRPNIQNLNKREYTYKINDKRIKEDNSKRIEEPKVQYDISSYQRYKNFRRYGNENEKPKYETNKLRGVNSGAKI